MYEVRPENSIHRVDSDTSLAGAIEKADNIARTNRRRYVVVQCKTVYVAEAAPVTELPNEPVYVQQIGRGNFTPFAGTVTGRLRDWLTQGQPPKEPEEIDSSRTKPAPVVTDLVVTRKDALLGHTPADPQSLKHRTKP